MKILFKPNAIHLHFLTLYLRDGNCTNDVNTGPPALEIMTPIMGSCALSSKVIITGSPAL